MDKEKSSGEPENIELRINEMKNQFQKSYEIFMNANSELSKISFSSFKLQDKSFNSEAVTSLNSQDVDEILTAGSVDNSIEVLRSKISTDDENFKKTFPDISKLLKIMNHLQLEIDGLKDKQDQFAKLANDVNEEMNRFEKELDLTATQMSEITGEHSDEEIGEDADDEISDTATFQDNDDAFDSEFYSD